MNVPRKEAREILRGLPKEAAVHRKEECRDYCLGEKGCTAFHEGEECVIYGLSSPHGEGGEGTCTILVEETYAMVEREDIEVIVDGSPMRSPYWVQESGENLVGDGEALRPDGNKVYLDDVYPWELREDPCTVRAQRLNHIFYVGEGLDPPKKSVRSTRASKIESSKGFRIQRMPKGVFVPWIRRYADLQILELSFSTRRTEVLKRRTRKYPCISSAEIYPWKICTFARHSVWTDPFSETRGISAIRNLYPPTSSRG